MEIEDDVYFADLSRQISLLIMEDDDEDPVARYPSASIQERAVVHPASSPSQLNMHEQTCRREIKGTGVFIPQSSQPRRKQRQGRYTNSINSKPHRLQPAADHHSNTRMLPQLSYNNPLHSK